MPHKRPLSPHLQIYKPQITSMLSILHRATGLALSTAICGVSFWVISTLYGHNTYTDFLNFMTTPVGKVILVGWIFSFFYHFYNGIRHLFWDGGIGLELKTAIRTGWFVVVLTLASSFAYMTFIYYYYCSCKVQVAQLPTPSY